MKNTPIHAEEGSLDHFCLAAENWIEDMQFTLSEIAFLRHFLAADIYRQGIPNLFERLQQFKHRLQQIETNLQDWKDDLHEHLTALKAGSREQFKDLKGIWEEFDPQAPRGRALWSDYRLLKAEIYSYAMGVLN